MKDSVENEELVLDTSGTECPIPVLKARKLASELNKDTIIKIIATDPLAEADFEHYCDQSNYEYLSCEKMKDKILSVEFKKPIFDIICNVTAKPENNSESIKKLLVSFVCPKT